jgi:verruculogen synthase
MAIQSALQPHIQRYPVTAGSAAIIQALQDDGVVIIEGFLTPEQVEKFNDEVNPRLDAIQQGGNTDKGSLKGSLANRLPVQQRRVHNLAGFSRTFRHDILNHELMHAICQKTFEVSGDYWLASGAVIDNSPGTPEQILHRDQPSYPVLKTGPTAPQGLVNFFTALTDFTKESGAT